MEPDALVASRMLALDSLRPVQNGEATPYALPAHAKCRGGVVGHWLPLEKQRLCECAQKRFMAENKDRVTSVNGRMFWLKP